MLSGASPVQNKKQVWSLSCLQPLEPATENFWASIIDFFRKYTLDNRKNGSMNGKKLCYKYLKITAGVIGPEDSNISILHFKKIHMVLQKQKVQLKTDMCFPWMASLELGANHKVASLANRRLLISRSIHFCGTPVQIGEGLARVEWSPREIELATFWESVTLEIKEQSVNMMNVCTESIDLPWYLWCAPYFCLPFRRRAAD